MANFSILLKDNKEDLKSIILVVEELTAKVKRSGYTGINLAE